MGKRRPGRRPLDTHALTPFRCFGPRAFWSSVVALCTPFILPVAFAQPACEQIAAACREAGFVQGRAASGDGLLVDCIEPIMQGSAQRRRANKPLPLIAPQLIAACKAGNPGFGQPKTPVTDKAEPPMWARPVVPLMPDRDETPTAPAQPSPLPQSLRPRGSGSNIVFILTDDLAWNLVQYMPHVLRMQKDGVTFANYFVTDSLCCPSRSSIFTGRYPHDTGVFRNTGNDGGYMAFVNRGNDRATFATALSAAGYRTAMTGKYLNGYLPPKHPAAPGWTSWAVAGNAYAEFNYDLNQDGRVVQYGRTASDYLTDVLSRIGVRFIRQATDAPFLIEIATFAPHGPYTPAPRDTDAFPGLVAPRTASFNAAPDANAAKWLFTHPALTDADIARIDRAFRMRAQAVLAVDKMIGELQAAVAAIGEENNTYFVFSSDNGYHMGEHRLMPGKMTAYDTDIRVPLIVTGPGVPRGITVDEIVANVDLCPTFAELAGAQSPPNVDGRSLVPLLHGQKVADWRTVALVEHRGPHTDRSDPDAPAERSGNPTTYEAIRALTSVYVEYADGEREYHDLATDPHELRNSFASLPNEAKASLHTLLERVKNCHDAASCQAAERGERR
jgi:N-acetylglucosamine-6-sulfatase